MAARFRQYLELTKPRVVALIVFTAVIGMFLAVPGFPGWRPLLLGSLGIWLAAGSAAAINHLIDQRIDKLMVRTAHRPLAVGALTPLQVLVFALLLGEHQHQIGMVQLDQIEVLVDRIGRTLIPTLVDPLLRRHDVGKLAQLAAEIPLPAHVDVPVETHRLVLGQHEDLAQPTIQAVGEGKVDDPISAAKRHRRLGPVSRERIQSRALAPGQDHRDYLVLHVASSLDPPCSQ